jgi:asparagine synthase (glutamine-hydrolysing)
MCGIAGYAGAGAPETLTRNVAAMTASLARRGPDGEGMEQWPGAVLGHRRLAIIDLSEAGRQPMLSNDGETAVVFNGCIYNFQEIRKELESFGRRFSSQCDTEVLVQGYEQWGIDPLVQRLRGMFAFAVWDNRARTLTLVRDRLGVKPLVYVQRGGDIAFASTVTALRAAGLVDEIDPVAMLEFLEFGWVSDERTIFGQAKKVPAATIIEWRDGRIVGERPYWALPEAGSRKLRFTDAVEQAESLLLESVKLRLISDVPIGCLLSGGIDSSLVCWAVSKLNADLKAFTVGTAGDPTDESDAARRTAALLGIPHEVIALPPDEQPDLADLTCAYGEPFACPSALAMLRVCRAVKPKLTVLLTGDGGDDVFLGYEHHRAFLLAQRLSPYVPGALAPVARSISAATTGIAGLRRAARLIDYATGGLGAVTEAHDGLPYFQQSGMLGERLRGIDFAHRQIPRSHISARALLPEYLQYERRMRFVAEYMTKVDGGAMFHGIEARSPFLDQMIWEFAAALPFNVRLRRNELKAVLRALVRKNIGDEVADRQKQGFTVPVARWLTAGWRPQLEALKENSVLEDEGWIRRGTLRAAVEQALTRERAALQLWSLVVLEYWARNNLVREHLAATR